MLKIFKRKCWRKNGNYANGYEPIGIPVESCRVVTTADTPEEAREICTEANKPWRNLAHKMSSGFPTAREIKTYFESPRFEYTEIS